MEEPLLSVCLITYNHEKYIEQAIEGVLMQKTAFKIELIIADDCSTDNTQEILKSYKEKHPELITLILQKVNKGPAQNWLDLITTPKTKYTAYFEGDDYWTDPLKLQKQVDFMEGNPEFGICFHRANLLTDDGAFSLHSIPEISKEGEFIFADLLEHYNFITTASVLFRNPKALVFPKWFEEIPFGDMGLYFLLSRGNKIKCLNDVMSVYRIHSEGVFQKKSKLHQKMQHLQFYSHIHSSLSQSEKKISNQKIKEYIGQIAYLKFPKSQFMRFVYKYYLTFSK